MNARLIVVPDDPLDADLLQRAIDAELTVVVVEAPTALPQLEAPPVLVVRAYVNGPMQVHVAPDLDARHWTINALFVDVYEIRGSWWKVYPAPGKPGRELWLHGGQPVIC